MAQNAIDGGSRRFILVQLPQPLDPSVSEHEKAAVFCDSIGRPRTIAEITKERLRRAAAKVRESTKSAPDTGFRVFRLDSSNIRAWQPTGDIAGDLLTNVDHLVDGRTEADLLTELLLKLGLDLCVPIVERQIAGKTLHSIGGGVLMACLDPRITEADAEPLAQGIAQWLTELAPAGERTCVFRDSAFANDVAKTNLAAILDQHGVHHVRSL